jgi:hypothetical protein
MLMLTACGGRSGLHDLGSVGQGPDEFSVLPTRPLEIPQSLSALPAPTPGGSNLTDPNPIGDAMAALGGRQDSLTGGIPASDAALVTRASRYGVDPAIRADLAAEDAAFRRRKAAGNAFNWFGRDRYFSAYASQSLDAYAELLRFRNLGVQVPSAPPQ